MSSHTTLAIPDRSNLRLGIAPRLLATRSGRTGRFIPSAGHQTPPGTSLEPCQGYLPRRIEAHV